MRFTVEFDSLEDIQELESKLAKLDDLIDAVEDLRQLNEELRRMVGYQLQSKLEEEDYPPE
jgi:phage-related protein